MSAEENNKDIKEAETTDESSDKNNAPGSENGAEDGKSAVNNGDSVNKDKADDEKVPVEAEVKDGNGDVAGVDVSTLTEDEVKEAVKKAKEYDELLDKLKRTQAEYANFQKRKIKEAESIRQYAVQDVVVALTNVADNFSRAIFSTKESKDFDKLLEGIHMVEGELKKLLERCGVKEIETEGKPFDPALHEAVMEEENDSHPHHTVTMELQKGFVLHDRVIRPAKVKVSKKSANATPEEDKKEEEPKTEEK